MADEVNLLAKRRQTSCMDAALTYLTMRMRSAHEMQTYLKKREYPQDEIDAVMQRLRELELIDDEAFARELVRNKTALRPTGRRALSQALYRAGIDRDTAQVGLETYSREDEQQACEALFEKLVEKNGTEPKALAKIQRSLIGKGFAYDAVYQAAQRYKGLEWE